MRALVGDLMWGMSTSLVLLTMRQIKVGMSNAWKSSRGRGSIVTSASKNTGVNLLLHLEAFESRVIDFGEEGELTILAGTRYAELLLKFSDPRYADTALGCKRRGEALDLLSRMKAISVWVFGPDHHATEVIGRVFRENGLLE